MRQVLNAVAKLTRIDVKEAASYVRKHPLWREEIHIEEELINLEEAFASAAASLGNLREYPKMRIPIVHEQRAILTHCVGLIARMTRGKQLPREYSDQDIMLAVTKLTRLIIDEAIRVGKKIDDQILKILKPHLSFRQRLVLRQWSNYSPSLELKLLKHRLRIIRQFSQ